MSEGNIQTVSEQLKSKIKGMDLNFKSDEVGTVTSVGDGIAKVYGLDQAWPGSWFHLTMAFRISSES